MALLAGPLQVLMPIPAVSFLGASIGIADCDFAFIQRLGRIGQHVNDQFLAIQVASGMTTKLNAIRPEHNPPKSEQHPLSIGDLEAVAKLTAITGKRCSFKWQATLRQLCEAC